MLSRNIRPVTPVTRRLFTDKAQLFTCAQDVNVLSILLVHHFLELRPSKVSVLSHGLPSLLSKPIPEILARELIFDGLRDFILVLPRGHVFLAGFGAAELDEITIYSDGIIVEKSRVTVVPVSQFDLHNASKTVSIVDNSLHFVKDFSRFVLKGLASHVYNSQTYPVTSPTK